MLLVWPNTLIISLEETVIHKFVHSNSFIATTNHSNHLGLLWNELPVFWTQNQKFLKHLFEYCFYKKSFPVVWVKLFMAIRPVNGGFHSFNAILDVLPDRAEANVQRVCQVLISQFLLLQWRTCFAELLYHWRKQCRNTTLHAIPSNAFNVINVSV